MKQVPAYDTGDMDEKTGLLNRNGLEAVINPSDMSALEAALRIKESYDDTEIYVFTMGPKSAESIITEAYAYGVDKGYLICDKAFAGADVIVTAYTLKEGISSVGKFDLIICGRETTDGDTGLAPGALAKWLNIPHFNQVTKIKSAKEKDIEIVSEGQFGFYWKRISLPILISVEKESFISRMPKLNDRIKANKKEVYKIGLEDLEDKDASHYGIKGSATKVKKIFPPKKGKHKKIIHEDESLEAVRILKAIKKYTKQ
jgi:electron transfer flavoprotein beta subunit